MSKKNKRGKTPNSLELPDEDRWRFEEAAMKARPLCDALARLEDAIWCVIDGAVHSLVEEGKLDAQWYYSLAHFYCKDAVESARHRWDGFKGDPDELDGIVKEAVDLLVDSD